jgi:hypothetical protein
MKKLIIILFLSCWGLSSCKKFLDTKPQDFVSPENYYNTEADLNKALYGIYNRLIDTYGRLYQRGLWSYFAISDEFFYSNITSNNIKVMDFDASQLDIANLWSSAYQGIDRANELLANINKPVIDEIRRNNIKGQALFLRAYYYYLLVDLFGPVPLKLNPTTSPTDATLPRSLITDVYAQIITDMKAAEPLINTITTNNTNELVSQSAVQAVLARVYLTMAGAPVNDISKYQDALMYADKVITSGSHSLNSDYKQIFINESQDIIEPKECIWEIAMYGNQQGTAQVAGSVGIDNGILCADNTVGYSAGTIHITSRSYNLYNASDLRRDWSIAAFVYTTSSSGVTTQSNWSATQIYDRNIGKWRRIYETLIPKNRVYNSTNFPVIRYSDVLLMKAEAENQINGPTAAAYDAINQVRRRGFGKQVNVANTIADLPTGLNKTAFFAELQNERERELCFEGLRKHDLIRWGIYISNMQSLVTEITASAPATWQKAAYAAKNITNRNVLFPIPTTELTSNPLAKQNIGW